MNIELSSAVARVVVHARGALVTRVVTLPKDLSPGVVDVALPGVTLLAQPGSARAALEDSDRLVAAVHAALVVSEREVKPGPTLARVRELGAKAARITEGHRALSERRTRLVELALAPHVRPVDAKKRERDVLDVRFGEALRMAALLRDKVSLLDAELLGLEREHRDVARELEAAQLEDRQTSSRERMGEDHPTRTITARIVGEGRPGLLFVTYAIPAARWWPAYTLRLQDGGRHATWTFEAIVAQKSGEDWSAVPLSLSSGDLVYDARLPELASLRFGRAQSRGRNAPRPPPIGIDEMFGPYLAFGGGAFASPAVAYGRVADLRVTSRESVVMAESFDDEVTSVTASVAPETAFARRRPPTPGGVAASPASMTESYEAGAPARPMMAMAMPSAPPMALGFGGAAPLGASRGMLRMSRAESEPFEPAESELVASDSWNDYDTLELANADAASRGRLVPRGGRTEGEAARAIDDLERIDGTERLSDPAESRGMFDHRYDAEGLADVPSDGRVHRVTVGSAPCGAKIAWRSTPCETQNVYREAHLTNPFDTGLIGGPVDVYLDGSLLTTTAIEQIDRGGSFFCGMGVDDRLKIARNVRVDEESAGMLGGSTAVTHTVQIDLASTIKDKVLVTVLDRVPVTDDKALEIKMVSARPPGETYDQADRDDPIRGGLRFDVTVAPAAKTTIEVVYRLVFASKLDIVGGSRRG